MMSHPISIGFEMMNETQRQSDTVNHGVSLCFSVAPCLRGIINKLKR
jgi:hypothetical protein